MDSGTSIVASKGYCGCDRMVVGFTNTRLTVCNQCLSLLKLWVRILSWWCILDTTLCDKVCQWFSPGTSVSSTNKFDRSGNFVESNVKHQNSNRSCFTGTRHYINRKSHTVNDKKKCQCHIDIVFLQLTVWAFYLYSV